MTHDLHKCVTAEEMARIEKLAIACGSSETDFMEKAGHAVAHAVLDRAEKNAIKKGVVLFAGTGNNGADGFVAALYLMKKGVKVKAYVISTGHAFSPLCKMQSERFVKEGGAYDLVNSKELLPSFSDAVIIDALVGTGFKGKALGILADAIERINASSSEVFSVDIPSGLSAATGDVETVAVYARYTVYLELAKIGFFIRKGWDHVGALIHASFGLPLEFIDQAVPSAFLPSRAFLRHLLPKIKRSRHKYEAGYVIALAGSSSMDGAAILSTTAALHAGAGIVRLFHPLGLDDALSKAPSEIIKEEICIDNMEKVFEEMKRASAMLVGPGLGRASDVERGLKVLLQNMTVPCVIDADALFFLAQHPGFLIPEGSILTPHHAEMRRLLGSMAKDEEIDFLSTCWKFAFEKKVILVLKGAPTIVFDPSSPPVIIPHGDPGMATAGSGDVLTGIIAAMLAGGLGAKEAAILSVYLHAKAGEIAAKEKTSYSMVASDLIDFLPNAFKTLLYKAKE